MLEDKLEELLTNHQQEIISRDQTIHELEEKIDRNEVDISQISKISKKERKGYGQLYGGDEKVGRIEQQ